MADQLSNTLNNLSKTAGVDLNALKDKYRNIQRETAQCNASSLSAKETKDLERLNNYKICKTCLGKGTVKTIYNHMVLERDCEECDGDSIILTQERIDEIAKGLS